MPKSSDYEKGFEDGFRDGHQAAALIALGALELAMQRLDLSDYDGDEQENMVQVQKAIDQLKPFVA